MGYVLNCGFGDAVKDSQYIAQGGTLAAAGATALVGSIAASGGTILGLAASSLVPVVGPILAGLTMAIQTLVRNSGCGVTCVETSQWANQAAAQLDQLIHAYFALPVPRPKSAQILYLANFNTIWQRLGELCGQPGTGNAGVRCISDRQAGACTWHQTADKVPPWGVPPAGSCWNWFNGYRDPVANDPDVYDDTVSSNIISGAAADVGSFFLPSAPGPGGIAPVWWLAGAGLLLAAVAL